MPLNWYFSDIKDTCISITTNTNMAMFKANRLASAWSNSIDRVVRVLKSFDDLLDKNRNIPDLHAVHPKVVRYESLNLEGRYQADVPKIGIFIFRIP